MPKDQIDDGNAVAKLQSSLYISRPVLNGQQIIDWAKGQGFAMTLDPADLHCTLVYCADPVEWDALGISPNPHVSHGGARSVEPLGDGGAVVLKFEDPILDLRWRGLIAAGAKSNFDSFTPHVSISWNVPDDFDLSAVKPFVDPIHFGPEVLKAVDPNWSPSKIVEKARVVKVADDLGIVFGWAIICTIDGQPYFDLNIDRDGPLMGQRVPENVPDDVMLRAAAEFAKTARPGNDMHDGPDVGTFDFIFPLTAEMAQAFGIQTRVTGLLVGYRPTPDLLAKFKSGERRGFSIEGWRDDGKVIN